MNAYQNGVPANRDAESLPDCLNAFLDQWCPEPNRVVLAVSGGADSVALLTAWGRICQVRRDQLLVATFDHGLRPNSADDAMFVKTLANSLQLECIVGNNEPGQNRVPGRSPEESARIARYDFLSSTARQANAPLVATAHTADDQVETVLMAILRGTGLAGLAAMQPKRPLADDVTLIRPLLDVRRSTIVDYLASIGQSHRVDETNENRRFTRNRIRHELLPLLRNDYNARVDEAVLRLSRQARSAATRESTAAAELTEQWEESGDLTSASVDAGVLASADRQVACAALVRLLDERGWPRKRIGTRELERILTVASGEGPRSLDLPDGLRVQRSASEPVRLQILWTKR